MTCIRMILGAALAISLSSSIAQAELLQLDFFSEGQAAQPDVEFSVTLDGNTGYLDSYSPHPNFRDISGHGTLRVGGTTVLDETGIIDTQIGTDEGISFLYIGGLGVEARFAARPGDGPDNGYVIAFPWPSTPSQVHLVFDPGVHV